MIAIVIFSASKIKSATGTPPKLQSGHVQPSGVDIKDQPAAARGIVSYASETFRDSKELTKR